MVVDLEWEKASRFLVRCKRYASEACVSFAKATRISSGFRFFLLTDPHGRRTLAA